MPLWKITDNGPSLENPIVAGAQGKIERFKSIGLHYNLVADAVYKKRSSLDSPFDPQYLDYIVAGLISFDMQRMMGRDRRTGGFASLLAQKLEKIKPLISHLIRSNLTSLDIEKEKECIKAAYKVLAERGKNGLNQNRNGEFHVGATKILHFLNPDAFLIIDRNASSAFRSHHSADVSFKNSTQPGYTADKYIACMKCAKEDILDYGADNFRALERETPLARIYDKLTFITGSDLS